jgi:hypothetical protein
MNRLLKVVNHSGTYDVFIGEITRFPKWYLDERTKTWKKNDFMEFYKNVKKAIGGEYGSRV